MSNHVHKDPLLAWKYLCDKGGVELNGRDEGLDHKILQRLAPNAPSLEAALAASSMDSFAQAFFEAIHPYVAIFHDILDFFEKASATKSLSDY